MAPKKRAFAELGSVASHAGSYSAQFSIREAGRIRFIYGPRRRNKLRALGDLNVIRAAAAESESRADGFEAMEAAAKRLKADAAAEAGGVEKVGGEYRARVRYATASGEPRLLQGPRRLAQADLEAMRAAAQNQPSRAEHFQAMADKAHALQEHAVFETQVAMSMGKRRFGRQHMQTDSETEPEPDPDAAFYKDHFPEYDVTDPQTRERLYTAPPRKKPRQVEPPTDEIEATKALATFSPVRSGVHDLRALLVARADPNATVGLGNVSPLRNVLCFARPCDVRDMRLLLLEYGAFQSSADAKRWADREQYDMMEPEWLANFHRDDREG